MRILYVILVMASLFAFVGTLTASERFVVTSHSSGFMVTSRPAVPVASTLGIVNREAGHVSGAGGGHDAPTAVYLYVGPGCAPCVVTKAYWAARGNKGKGYVIIPTEKIPTGPDGNLVTGSIPAYHWANKKGQGRLSVGISAEQFQSAFEQGEL